MERVITFLISLSIVLISSCSGAKDVLEEQDIQSQKNHASEFPFHGTEWCHLASTSKYEGLKFYDDYSVLFFSSSVELVQRSFLYMSEKELILFNNMIVTLGLVGGSYPNYSFTNKPTQLDSAKVRNETYLTVYWHELGGGEGQTSMRLVR